MVYKGMTNGIHALPPNSRILGLTYGEWAAKWWQWILSIPANSNPANDTDGSKAYNLQNGPIWFLAGTFDPLTYAERYIKVAGPKLFFVPIISTEKSWLEFPDFKEHELRARAKNAIDRVNKIWANVNGLPVNNLERFRIKSDLFPLDLAKNNVLGLGQARTKAVAEGYYLILEQLGPGTYEVDFGGLALCVRDQLQFSTHVKYHITIIN